MSDLNEIKQKYKSLAKYIVEVDEGGKIIFLEYEKLCSELNKTNQRKTIVLVLFRHILKNELIHPDQVSDILIVIENEIFKEFREIREYINDVDKTGDVNLIPKKELVNKIYEEKNNFLIKYFRINDMLTLNLIAEKYLKEQWINKKNLQLFLERRYETLSKQDYNNWEESIVKYARSDAPLTERINFISELLTDLYRVDSDGDIEMQSTINWFEPLLRELENKLKSFDIRHSNNVIQQKGNPHQFIFPDENCWEFYKYWKENASVIKADLVYIYWKMKEENLIYPITVKQYTDWLYEKIGINLKGYWKQLHRLDTPKRRFAYSTAKDKFNL